MPVDEQAVETFESGWEARPFGRGNQTPRQRYTTEVDWLRRWTLYSDVLRAALLFSERTENSWTAPEDVLLDMGRPTRRLYRALNVSGIGAGAELGRVMLADYFMPVLQKEYDALPKPADESAWHRMSESDQDYVSLVCAWYYTLTARTAINATQSWTMRTYCRQDDPGRARRTYLWPGMDRPKAFQSGSGDRFKRLTEAFDTAFAALSFRNLPDRELTDIADPDELLRSMVPPDLAEKLEENAGRVARMRQAHEDAETTLGIDDQGRTDLYRAALPRLAERLAANESMMILGPTSSGKSHVGRIAIAHALHRRPDSRAIVLLPTKALVTQACDEWNEFKRKTEQEPWRVLAGSRDYPENDEALIRGEFEIAILIPEKLAALMANGMTLGGCGLLVVDELQHLAEKDRGARLEVLLTQIRKMHAGIPILGLSATLTDRSAEMVCKWLGIDTETGLIQGSARPVPLETIVCNGRQAKRLKANKQDVDYPSQDLESIIKGWEEVPTIAEYLNDVGHYKRGLALSVAILDEDRDHGDAEKPLVGGAESGKRVLCFVGGRDSAEGAAVAARAALQADPRLQLGFDDVNPFLGRFSTLTKEKAEERRRAFERFPDTTVRQAVAEALRTGVGFHTARLEQSMRGYVEAAFREGLIRLLFATDTLKLGLNLPADCVVVATPTTPAGGGLHKVLDRDAAAQRLGRAGRLGFSSRGSGYLVIPTELPRRSSIIFDQEDLDGLASLVPSVGVDEEEPKDRALRALNNVEAVFAHYLKYTERGTAISSRLDDEWYCRLLLQEIARNAPSYSRADLEVSVDKSYNASLGAISGAAPPDGTAIVDRLLRAHLIGPSAERGDLFTITGLGRALSTSGLPIADAPVVERLGAAVNAGAGELSLIWVATEAEGIRHGFDWISLNTPQDDPGSTADMKRRLVLLAKVFTCPLHERKAHAANLKASEFIKWLPDQDLVGDGPAADELRTLVLGVHREDPEDRVALNGLLRACVLLLWSYGAPMEVIEFAIRRNVRVRLVERGRNRWRAVALHATDVRSLGELASYVFGAATELLGVRPVRGSFRRLQQMGDALQVGVPAQLAPLTRLNLASTHRERIVYLSRVIHGKTFDNIADVVDKYLRLPDPLPKNAEARRRVRLISLSPAERAEIRHQLERKEGRRGERLSQLPATYRRVHIPGLGQRFGWAADNLCEPEAQGLEKGFTRLLQACGLSVRASPERPFIEVSERSEPGAPVYAVRIVTSKITAQSVGELAASAHILVAVGGMTLGVGQSLSIKQTVGTVLIEPALMLEAMARVVKLHSDEDLEGDDEFDPYDIGHLLGINGEVDSGDSENIEVEPTDEDGETARHQELEDELMLGVTGPLGDGMELAGKELLSVLLAAPPVVTRSDLNRLIAGLRVAAPPPLHYDSNDVIVEGAVSQ